MNTADYTVSPYDPNRAGYSILLRDGNRGNAYLIKMTGEGVPKKLVSELEKTLNSCNVSDLNVFNFNFFPFGVNNQKYEGQGLGSRIYDDLNIETTVEGPALILARPSTPKGSRIDNLFRRKGFEYIEIEKDYVLFYKLIPEKKK